MGVYIKGMEMPEDGAYLCEIGVAGDIATLTIHGGIEEERKAYPFIAVPDHGDMIDRDEFIKKILNTPVKALDGVVFDQTWFTRMWDATCQFLDEVERQVAIIPADKETG